MKKRILSLILCFVFVIGAFFAFSSSGFAKNDFKPVFRFVAASDTHVRDDSNVNAERIGKMMNIAYREAAKDASHKNVDALMICGDLTNDGTKTEFDKFWNAVSGSLKGNTQFLGVVAKNHDGYEMSRKDMRGYYTSLTGNEPDFHTVIGGYHFIGISASSNDAFHYDLGQIRQLKKWLDEATAEDPDKPVFVMHHEHIRDTVYGSSYYDGWGRSFFTSVLSQYPQVVDFSGHSHYPLNHPRSIWQGTFTAIGTGAIYYSEFTVDIVRSYHPEDSGDTATFWIVELDKDSNMRLRGFDAEAGKCLCEEILKNPASPANRDYTNAKRKAASSAPVFDSGAKLSVDPEYGSCTIVSPVAKSTDGMPVVLYRAYAYDSMGIKVADTWTLPSYYRAVQQDEVVFKLEGLAKGDYTVEVVAETAYGVQSEPLSEKITVDGSDRISAFFGRIKLFFENVKYYLDQLIF